MTVPTAPPITVEDIRARVAWIAALASGKIRSASREASAHAEEDELYFDVLTAIAAGAPNAEALARSALESSGIGFIRWFE